MSLPDKSVDVEIVSEISEELLRGFQLLIGQLSSTPRSITKGDLEKVIAAPSNTVWIAKIPGAASIIGTLTLVEMQIPTGSRAWIEDVVVDSSARGLGAGEALVRAALRHAKSNGARNVDLTSNPARVAAHRLYEKVGFKVRDTRVYRHTFG